MLWFSALVTFRTVMDPTDRGTSAQKARAWKRPACLINSRTERRKTSCAVREWQDQARCLEQRRTRGCTTHDACLQQKQSGQWSCRWETGPLAAVRYESARETSCRAWWTETGSIAANTCTESCVEACVCAQIEKMALPQARPSMLCIH